MGRKLVISGGAVAALLALATPQIAKFEGLRTTPYRDVIGKLTVCFGETEVKMRKYTVAECNAMLDGRAKEFGLSVASRNPNLIHHPYQWAAATSLAYNIGKTAYNNSTVARNFEAGKWEAACRGFSAWRMAGGKVNQGLVNRRNDEIRLCLTQLPRTA